MVHPGIMIRISIVSPKKCQEKQQREGGGVCKVCKNTTNAFV